MTRLLHLDRTLDELDGPAWPLPPSPTTALVAKVHALRRERLGDLSPADLRTLIGQDVGLPYVLPLAVRTLVEDPMLDAYFHPGDLLLAVLTRPESAWTLFPDLREELAALVADLSERDRAELRACGPRGWTGWTSWTGWTGWTGRKG
ncbi:MULTISPECIES: contact-dependent growth inhibition system immunity protein [unclassified Streptomyces]|uniref:contact-dependent growth inhibition system immunity protein n=1 Tax=unclassified Streptomyces TaxID=2593676 RepID=UPI000689A304|nr:MULTISPECIES: contact-dependent growth inhibition system immunity protein [unclassified Streptomyces]